MFSPQGDKLDATQFHLRKMRLRKLSDESKLISGLKFYRKLLRRCYEYERGSRSTNGDPKSNQMTSSASTSRTNHADV